MALLGTERAHLTKKVMLELDHLGIQWDQEPGIALLEAVAIYGQMRKVGIELLVDERPVPASITEEDEAILDAKSAHHLKLILNGTYEGALPEFIRIMGEEKRILPPRDLPDLLDRAVKDEVFWHKIKPLIGRRGAWLKAQHPQWKKLEELPLEEDWVRGTGVQRRAFLEFYRRESPEDGLALLLSTWEDESLRDKVAFLRVLKTGLSIKDEYFLEECLYHSRKEIRREAAHLLASIADSELVERMYIRVLDCIRIDGGVLNVVLPDDLDETASRDGIELLRTQKSEQLAQMIACIPPTKWEVAFDLSVAELLRLFYNDEWSTMLIPAIVNASHLHRTEEWSCRLLQMWLHLGNSKYWEPTSMIAIANALQEVTFNELLAEHLQRHKGYFTERAPIVQLLLETDHSWDSQLSFLVINRFQLWLSSGQATYWNNGYNR